MIATSTTAANAPAAKPGANEEPELTQEESVPSDGKDEVGEKMMEELGRDLAQQKKG